MKFILTINWTLISVEEILKIEYEEDSSRNRYTSYFILKNGDKHDVHDTPNSFNVDDDKEYILCSWCHRTMNIIILKYILNEPDKIIFIDQMEDKFWEDFIEMCRNNLDKLQLIIKPSFKF